jgi:phage repressor protein C with HTH and peptisase S24 domain
METETFIKVKDLSPRNQVWAFVYEGLNGEDWVKLKGTLDEGGTHLTSIEKSDEDDLKFIKAREELCLRK